MGTLTLRQSNTPKARQVVKERRIEAEKAIQRQAKERRSQAARDLLARLTRDYPKLFNPSAPLPLKIGIHKDIQAVTGTPIKIIHLVMWRWCKRKNYQNSLTKGSPRYALDGAECGEVEI